PPCRQSVAKLQPVRNQHPNAQMLSQRAHYVVEALAYQHYFLSVRLRFLQFVDAPLLQRGFQQILKILLPQEVKPVTANSAQDRVQQARGERAIRQVEDGTRQRQRKHAAPPRPSLEETLRIPRKKSHGTHSGQVEQTAFDAPIGEVPAHGWGHRGLRQSVATATVRFRLKCT